MTEALPRIRALLDRLGVRATFFVEGRNAELYPGALRALAADGHEVALHGWCHEPWAELGEAEERALLTRGRTAMAALGIDVRGFRPPGGRLTGASLRLLRELGFAHCSPAGTGAAVLDGVAVLPFRWPLIDAFHVLPRFAPLRGEGGSHEAALADALRAGGWVSALFHPFLLLEDERLAVLERFLQDAAACGVRCAPHAELAPAVPADGGLELDLTPA